MQGHSALLTETLVTVSESNASNPNLEIMQRELQLQYAFTKTYTAGAHSFAFVTLADFV
jgi:hypothetical protein